MRFSVRKVPPRGSTPPEHPRACSGSRLHADQDRRAGRNAPGMLHHIVKRSPIVRYQGDLWGLKRLHRQHLDARVDRPPASTAGVLVTRSHATPPAPDLHGDAIPLEARLMVTDRPFPRRFDLSPLFVGGQRHAHGPTFSLPRLRHGAPPGSMPRPSLRAISILNHAANGKKHRRIGFLDRSDLISSQGMKGLRRPLTPRAVRQKISLSPKGLP